MAAKVATAEIVLKKSTLELPMGEALSSWAVPLSLFVLVAGPVLRVSLGSVLWLRAGTVHMRL
jgi:hypothetical protein